MPTKEDMRWFKQTFGEKIEPALQGTPFTLDLLTALACQETGEIWPILRKKNLTTDRILELCVGDSIDARSVFPRSRAELESQPNGAQMFEIARKALVDMAEFIPSYQGVAKMKNKFCHGFGIFQLDIQFFKNEPDYFLQRHYTNFDNCLQKAIKELQTARAGIGFGNKTKLTDLEMALVAVGYNMGTAKFKHSKGLKQGHHDGHKFYGELIFDFIRMAQTVQVNGGAPAVATSAPGTAAVPPATPVNATGKLFEVDVRENPLRLRSEARIDQDNANVIARLPDGHIVQAVTDKKINGFLEVETSLLGAHFHGFASADFLKPAAAVTEVPVSQPATLPPTSGIVAVNMPRKDNSVTKRTAIAGAFSLNEPNAPARTGTTPEELRSQIAAIVDYLAVDKPAHARYQPQPKATFCNVYAHDFCQLAGVYFPRVWWSAAAIEKLAQGKTVDPVLEATIDEQRANMLFRWLRDFGMRFGWRQTGDLTKLQQEVNQGAIGLIIARQKNEHRSGHVAVVVPETGDLSAKRNAAGEVIAPLQSQAGRHNFRYGNGGMNWWKSNDYAESAFWIHS